MGNLFNNEDMKRFKASINYLNINQHNVNDIIHNNQIPNILHIIILSDHIIQNPQKSYNINLFDQSMSWKDSQNIEPLDPQKNDDEYNDYQQYIQLKKQPQQFKALFLKNLRLQSKQKGTNLCQILTPILCIIFTFVMRIIAQQNMNIGAVYQPWLYPVKFNNFSQFDSINQKFNNSFKRDQMQWVTYSCPQQQQTNCTNLINSIKQYYNVKVPFHPNPINNSPVINMSTPFFLKPDDNKTIDNMLFQRTTWLTQQNFTQMKALFPFDFIPDGAYNISVIDDKRLEFGVKINDLKDISIMRRNGIQRIQTLRQIKSNNVQIVKKTDSIPNVGVMAITNWLVSTFIQSKNSSATMQSGVFFMPQDQTGISFLDTLINIVAVFIFPIALSLLFPVFLYTVVLQKQQKLIQMMKMNGMKIRNYWLVYFTFNIILSFLTISVFVLMGVLLAKMHFFTQTDPLLLIVTFIGWSLAQIGMAVFFQTFLSRSRSATIIGYLISIWTSMISTTLSIAVYQYPRSFPIGMRCFAFFGFPRIIYLMLMGCNDNNCYGNVFHIPQQMVHQIIMLYVNFIFFFFLGTYLFEILPQEYGTRKPILYPFIQLKKWVQKRLHKAIEVNIQCQKDPYRKKFINSIDQDKYSKQQRNDLLANGNVMKNNSLVINNLRKLYKKQGNKYAFAAVKSFNLKVGPKETFGLLGPNGAGKTTLISMLTGMFEPNYGNAWVAGWDIRTNIDKAQLQMGVCPQFDLLWPQLTVQQHLYFYARLKGISKKQISLKVQKAIDQVKLKQFKHFQANQLSGGMRRRLSIAISLVGDPKIVFLDQPSTGLDPENRRQLWEVLAKCQKYRAIFITTHMMEQADALCNRVGIITDGVLRTVAPQITLKKQYGDGYRVSMSLQKQQKKYFDRDSLPMFQQNDRPSYNHQQNSQYEQQLRKSVNSFLQTQHKQNNIKIQNRLKKIMKFMQQHFPQTTLLKQYNGYLIFKVKSKFKVSQIFQSLHDIQNQLQVSDISITNSSLQDVFINIVKQHEKQNDNNQYFNQFPQPNKNDPSLSINRLSQQNLIINKTPKHSQQLYANEDVSIISKNRISIMSNQNQPIAKRNIDSGYSQPSGNNLIFSKQSKQTDMNKFGNRQSHDDDDLQ